MRTLANGVRVKVLNYYKSAGIGASSYLSPLGPSDHGAQYADVEVLDGEHIGQQGTIITGALTN